MPIIHLRIFKKALEIKRPPLIKTKDSSIMIVVSDINNSNMKQLSLLKSKISQILHLSPDFCFNSAYKEDSDNSEKIDSKYIVPKQLDLNYYPNTNNSKTLERIKKSPHHTLEIR